MKNGSENTLADGARKTAIFLLSLDQVLAAEVLGKLPREQVERVTLAIANTNNVTREEQESILNEFKTAFASRPLMHPAGPEAAREMLERTLDQNDVEPAQQRIDEQLQAGPFAFLHNRHPDDVRRLVETEHPQTIAVIAAQLPPGLASQVLAGFDAERQAEILGRLARIGPTDVDVLADIATLLHERIGRVPVRTGGVSKAADVLRQSVRSTSRSVLQSLDQKDANLAETLRDSLFSFKELASLDGATFCLVLQETDQCQWAVALKGSSETLRQRVFSALSIKMAEGLKEQMSALGPVRLSEITAAQREIADATLKLEAENQIELPRKENRPRMTERV